MKYKAWMICSVTYEQIHMPGNFNQFYIPLNTIELRRASGQRKDLAIFWLFEVFVYIWLEISSKKLNVPMKKLLTWAAPALMAGMLFVGCQKNIESSKEARDVEPLIALTGGGDCTTDCIDENSGDEFAATASASEGWGGNPQNPPNNTKTLSVKVWNTLTTIEYRFTITGTGQAYNPGNLQYYNEGTLTWINIGALTTGVEFVVSRPLAANWQACDVVTEQWRQVGGGNPVSLGDVSYALIGECPSCDDESFSVEATNENLSLVFSYNGAEALTGATVEFTFPQILNLPLNGDGKYVAPDGKIYSVNNPTNQTVFTWVGDISCTTGETTFSFDVSPDCSAPPANDGEAVIWTDFKVNGVSKKGSYTNIKYLGCPL